MKTLKLFSPFLLLALLLSACGAGTVIPTEEVVALEAVYTAAALTVSAQSAAVTATPTPRPAATATLSASPTVMPTQGAASQPFSAPAAVGNSSSTCDNSSFLSDVTIPDGTVLAPNEAFTKTWSLQNSGSCPWSTSYSLAFVSGSAMSGSTTALASAVSSGGQINVSVALTAPSTAGTYTGYWKLQNASGTSFGQAVYVQIVVSSSAATVTPTPTAIATEDGSTSTPTSTSAPTSTTAPSATSAPTTAPTSTPEPTSTSVPEPTETPAS